MKITKEIKAALNKAVEARGGQAELARKAGLSKQHINNYVSGRVESITLENWQKLAPALRPYLGDTVIQVGGANHGSIATNHGTGADSKLSKDEMIKKILNSSDLDAETKVKVMKILSE